MRGRQQPTVQCKMWGFLWFYVFMAKSIVLVVTDHILKSMTVIINYYVVRYDIL